jgi:hypothetical protein
MPYELSEKCADLVTYPTFTPLNAELVVCRTSSLRSPRR